MRFLDEVYFFLVQLAHFIPFAVDTIEILNKTSIVVNFVFWAWQ